MHKSLISLNWLEKADKQLLVRQCDWENETIKTDFTTEGFIPFQNMAPFGWDCAIFFLLQSFT